MTSYDDERRCTMCHAMLSDDHPHDMFMCWVCEGHCNDDPYEDADMYDDYPDDEYWETMDAD